MPATPATTSKEQMGKGLPGPGPGGSGPWGADSGRWAEVRGRGAGAEGLAERQQSAKAASQDKDRWRYFISSAN